MSKSKGNVIDPIDSHRSLRRRRLALHAGRHGGAGPRHQALGSARRGLSQLRHQALERLALRGDERLRPRRRASTRRASREPLNRWILGEAAKAAAETAGAIESYRFNDAANAVYRFVWSVFCDWHLELAKPVLQGEADVRRKGRDAGDDRACARHDLRAPASVHAVPHRGALGDQGRGRAAARGSAGAGPVAERRGSRSTRRSKPRSAGSSI